jgi:hypothetical protein
MNDAPPLDSGYQQITGSWGLTLPYPMARRVDDGALVFWHSPRRFTSWTNIWVPDETSDAHSRLESLKEDFSPAAFDIIEEADGEMLRYSYRLSEDEGDDRQAAFYGFVVAPTGQYVQLAAYFDDSESIDDALSLWRSFVFQD